jgi:hypothetical protein
MSKPQLPARVDPELYAYLKYLRDRVSALEQAVGISDETDSGTGDEVSNALFEITYETPVTLAGSGEATSTEDAWTTLSAGAPSGARYAIIRFGIDSTDDADVANLKWRTESGAAEIPCVEVDSDQDDAAPRIAYFVTLDGAGQFQYLFTNTSATTITWSIQYVGYAL